MMVRKAQVVPFECVVRRYIEGSGWKDYQANQEICGVSFTPSTPTMRSDSPNRFSTPATKAATGHDENVTFERMRADLGVEVADTLRQRSLHIYRRGSEIAADRGILIADTKFEFGWFENRIILIDEVLTPRSRDSGPPTNTNPASPAFVR